jgi:16S rRNA G966 N2-methylase RsmD
MRIISGTHKSRRIVAPKNLPVRPTTDLSKEALFNILNNQYNFAEISVLDLFAGTGNISYEFASRGCTAIVAVDAHFGCVQFTKVMFLII